MATQEFLHQLTWYYVQAHMWYNLAASRLTGVLAEEAVNGRDEITNKLNLEQITEAQRLARGWEQWRLFCLLRLRRFPHRGRQPTADHPRHDDEQANRCETNASQIHAGHVSTSGGVHDVAPSSRGVSC